MDDHRSAGGGPACGSPRGDPPNDPRSRHAAHRRQDGAGAAGGTRHGTLPAPLVKPPPRSRRPFPVMSRPDCVRLNMSPTSARVMRRTELVKRPASAVPNGRHNRHRLNQRAPPPRAPVCAPIASRRRRSHGLHLSPARRNNVWSQSQTNQRQRAVQAGTVGPTTQPLVRGDPWHSHLTQGIRAGCHYP